MRKRGIPATSDPLERIAAVEPASFGAVCAFQLLEHVDSVDTLVASARELLVPGGRLFVSVPNRDRSAPPEFESLDAPPHHVSRWAPSQLWELANLHGFRLVRLMREPPDRSAALVVYTERIDGILMPMLGRRLGHLGTRLYRKIALRPARYEALCRRGSLVRRGIVGHTMLAEFAKEDDGP